MILGVAAAVYAFERREIIRQTWGTYANTEDVKLLFFVGDNGDANVNEHLIKGKTSPQSYSDRVFRSKRKPGHHPGELRRVLLESYKKNSRTVEVDKRVLPGSQNSCSFR